MLPLRKNWDSYPETEWDWIPYDQPLTLDDGIYRDVAPEPLFQRVKDIFMYRALEAKFTQHEDLREQLLRTSGLPIIEDTHNDPYWANGPSRNGHNKLGRLLMLLRERLEAQ